MALRGHDLKVVPYAVAESGSLTTWPAAVWRLRRVSRMRKRRPRLPRQRYMGPHRYSLTFCTLHRADVFLDAAVVTLVHQQIVTAASDHRFAVLAYCFMPNHLHLLVEGHDAFADFARFAKVTKQRTSYHYRQVTGRALWQPGWFDHQLSVGNDVGEAIAYVLMNPVRAGLVSVAEDYPFSGPHHAGGVTESASRSTDGVGARP